MPRPAKAAPARRDIRLGIRVASDEGDAMDARARDAGMTFAEYARDRLLRGPVEPRRAQWLPRLLWNELRNIGVNLKQLLALPDAGGIHPRVRFLLSRIQDIVQAAMDQYSEVGGDIFDWERDRIRYVRLTQEQRALIDALAARTGKSLSDYAREMLVHGRVMAWQIDEQVFPRYGELCAAGQALNDKTHAANARKRTGAGAAAVIEEIAALVDQVAEV
jgi:hypothetical protein